MIHVGRPHQDNAKNPISNDPNLLFFAADQQLLRAATAQLVDIELTQLPAAPSTRAPQANVGVLVTGDVFAPLRINRQTLHTQFGADAVDMESAAMAQVCWVQGTPYLAIRGISDTDDTAAAQIQACAAVAMQNAMKIVANALHNWC